jgi:transcriptional regulator with XRE-family HTH domain
VSARPVFHKELGEFFVELRTQRGWKQRQAASIAFRRRLKVLTRQVLLRLEAGRTKNPEPEVLRALAELYEMPYEDLVQRFVERRFGLALPAVGISNTPGVIENSEPISENPIDSVKPLSEQSARSKPSPVYTPRTLGEGSNVDRFGAAAEGPPASRQQSNIHDRRQLALDLAEYAALLDRAAAAKRILLDAAWALAGDENGGLGADRAGDTPRAGGAGGRGSRKGKS